MIRIAITTPSSLRCPRGAPLWPVQRQGGQCLVHVEAAVVERLRAMRGPAEDYSDVILRLTRDERDLGLPRGSREDSFTSRPKGSGRRQVFLKCLGPHAHRTT